MKQHLIACLIGGIVSGAVAFGVTRYAAPPAAEHIVTSYAPRAAWDGLSQTEIDRLTGILDNLPKHPVAIFCSHLCEELALDFDNAFESAHWESGIERPLVDSNVGINVGPAENPDAQALADAIAAATSGRLTPGIIAGRLGGDRLAIVISRKK